MFTPKRILVVSFCLVLFACKKKKIPETEPEPTPVAQAAAVKIDTIITFYPLNPALKPYYYFKDNSYWIYSDTSGRFLDSLYLTNYVHKNDTTRILANGKLNINVYETVSLSILCTHNGQYFNNTYPQSLFYYIKNNTIGIFTSLMNSSFARPYPFVFSLDAGLCSNDNYDTYSSFGDCQSAKDSLRLENGNSFKNVSIFLHYESGISMNSGLPTPSIKSQSVWSSGIGLIAYKTPIASLNNQLLRYDVSSR